MLICKVLEIALSLSLFPFAFLSFCQFVFSYIIKGMPCRRLNRLLNAFIEFYNSKDSSSQQNIICYIISWVWTYLVQLLENPLSFSLILVGYRPN